MWKNILEPDRPQMTVWRMHIACWIPTATNTFLECVMLIAFPLQQLLARTCFNVTLYLHCLSYDHYTKHGSELHELYDELL